mmetsp:Transcript_1958/g.2205  ORF Transcript_1958/g.2205 Transcript_1958/m.2205 type:complete len:81 (+) Transcript_1958:27-269(+)
MTRVRSMIHQVSKQFIDEERKGAGSKRWFPMLLKERQTRRSIRTKTPPTSFFIPYHPEAAAHHHLLHYYHVQSISHQYIA